MPVRLPRTVEWPVCGVRSDGTRIAGVDSRGSDDTRRTGSSLSDVRVDDSVQSSWRFMLCASEDSTCRGSGGRLEETQKHPQHGRNVAESRTGRKYVSTSIMARDPFNGDISVNDNFIHYVTQRYQSARGGANFACRTPHFRTFHGRTAKPKQGFLVLHGFQRRWTIEATTISSTDLRGESSCESTHPSQWFRLCGSRARRASRIVPALSEYRRYHIMDFRGVSILIIGDSEVLDPCQQQSVPRLRNNRRRPLVEQIGGTTGVDSVSKPDVVCARVWRVFGTNATTSKTTRRDGSVVSTARNPSPSWTRV